MFKFDWPAIVFPSPWFTVHWSYCRVPIRPPYIQLVACTSTSPLLPHIWMVLLWRANWAFSPKNQSRIFNPRIILVPNMYKMSIWNRGVTAHFVAPAQFVAGDKMCTFNGTFCRTLYTLSPQSDNICSRSRHILSPLREHQTNCAHIYNVTSRLVYSQCITSGVP